MLFNNSVYLFILASYLSFLADLMKAGQLTGCEDMMTGILPMVIILGLVGGCKSSYFPSLFSSLILVILSDRPQLLEEKFEGKERFSGRCGC
jgi:hypothetical protein